MDVWTLGEKYRAQDKDLKSLEERVKFLEEYLSKLTKNNKGKSNEKLQDKKPVPPSVRAGRRSTKKS
tara:strand:- start:277 stop:477 length:201 start_codon:yes stop_codon:yes gene_type:complete